jgi:hypothetical protein
MAADYNNYVYEDDKAGLHKIRLAQTSFAAQPGTAPAGAYTGIPVESRRSSRSQLLNVRGLRLVRTVGTAPNDKTFSTFLVCLSKAGYDSVIEGASITVNSVTYTVGKKIPETNTGY